MPPLPQVLVSSIRDAVDCIYAVAERDAASPSTLPPSASGRNSSAAEEVIDVLSHVPQLQNPHTLAHCAELLALSEDGLGCATPPRAILPIPQVTTILWPKP